MFWAPRKLGRTLETKLSFKETFVFSPVNKDLAFKYSKSTCKCCWSKGYIESDNFTDGNLLLGAKYIRYCSCVANNIFKIVEFLNSKKEKTEEMIKKEVECRG